MNEKIVFLSVGGALAAYFILASSKEEEKNEIPLLPLRKINKITNVIPVPINSKTLTQKLYNYIKNKKYSIIGGTIIVSIFVLSTVYLRVKFSSVISYFIRLREQGITHINRETMMNKINKAQNQSFIQKFLKLIKKPFQRKNDNDKEKYIYLNEDFVVVEDNDIKLVPKNDIQFAFENLEESAFKRLEERIKIPEITELIKLDIESGTISINVISDMLSNIKDPEKIIQTQKELMEILPQIKITNDHKKVLKWLLKRLSNIEISKLSKKNLDILKSYTINLLKLLFTDLKQLKKNTEAIMIINNIFSDSGQIDIFNENIPNTFEYFDLREHKGTQTGIQLALLNKSILIRQIIPY